MGKRVVILGAGVIGLCTAYYAARSGHRVTLLDRNPEDRDGCSFGNAGMIVPSHFVPLAAPGMVALGLKWMWNPESPFSIRPRWDGDLIRWCLAFCRAATQANVDRAAPLLRDLSLASRRSFVELAELPNNDFQLVQRGLLMLCKTQHGLDEEAKMADHALRLGMDAQVLDARETAARDPAVRMDVVGSVYFPGDCHLSPSRFMEVLYENCRQLGVAFRWQSEFRNWRTDAHRVSHLTTTDVEYEADEFVICGGTWSPALAKQLGLRLPIQAGKGYSLTLPSPRQLPKLCAIFTEARVAATPMGDALRFGGTMEIAGNERDVNPRRVRGIMKAVCQYYPGFQLDDFTGVEPWLGLRPCSPDGLPLIGRTRHFENVTIATGHAMMGLSLGPITGQLVASILSDEPTSIPIEQLSPDRFG